MIADQIKVVRGIRFDPPLIVAIEATAKQRGQSFSECVRDACVAFVGTQAAARQGEAKNVVQRRPQPFAAPRQHAPNCDCMGCQLKKGAEAKPPSRKQR